jgi:hypothetical protein
MPLLVPRSVTESIAVYVDEVYLASGTGVIQTAIPIPFRCDVSFEESAAAAGINLSSEFKANELSHRNYRRYGRFLEYTMGLVSALCRGSPLRVIVSVEGASRFCSAYSRLVAGVVNEAFATMGSQMDPHFVAEFGRQVVWVWRQYRHICVSPLTNPFRFVFDTKYSYAETSVSIVGGAAPNGLPLLWRSKDLFTVLANATLASLQPIQPHPLISEFGFGYSERCLPLQACDLIGNLLFASLKYRLGLNTRTNRLKHDLLTSKFPQITQEDGVLAALELHDCGVACQPTFSATCQFLP